MRSQYLWAAAVFMAAFGVSGLLGTTDVAASPLRHGVNGVHPIRVHSLIGTYVDSGPHPGVGRITLRADHTFIMYKGSAYLRLTPSGIVKLARVVQGTWEAGTDGGPGIEWINLKKPPPGWMNSFLHVDRASGDLINYLEGGTKGLPWRLKKSRGLRRHTL
jgi:hypothetical protein